MDQAREIAKQDRTRAEGKVGISQVPSYRIALLYRESVADKKLVGLLRDFLKATHFAPTEVSVPEGAPGDEVLKQISECPAMMVILSPQGHASEAESVAAWSSWIEQLPDRHRKLLLVLGDSRLGPLGQVLKPFCPPILFNASDLSSLIGPTAQALTQSRRELALNAIKYSSLDIPDLNHSILGLQKIVTIFPNRHGMTEVTYKIHVTRNECPWVPHHFGLNEFVEGKMKSLEELQTTDLRRRSTEATFTYRIIEASTRRGKLTMKPREMDCSPDGRLRQFRFDLTPPLAFNEELTYAWGVSSPDWFNIDKEDSSDFLCVNQFLSVDLILRFVHPDMDSEWTFEQPPELLVLDPLGQRLDRYPSATLQTLTWTEFSFLHIPARQGNMYRALWIPRLADWNTRERDLRRGTRAAGQ